MRYQNLCARRHHRRLPNSFGPFNTAPYNAAPYPTTYPALANYKRHAYTKVVRLVNPSGRLRHDFPYKQRGIPVGGAHHAELLTLIAISAMNSTTSSIQVVGNAQFREEAGAAAQQGIESIISSNFTINRWHRVSL